MGDQTEPLSFKGFLLEKDVTKEMMDVLPKLPARREDIFIASYPRSGSTWTQEIVWQILHNSQIDERRLDERVPFVEGIILGIKSYPYSVTDAESAVKVFTSFPEPRVFKTHLPYRLVPMGFDEANKPRYIYVMRNPKDVFVSMYHHLRNMPYAAEIPSWDEAFRCFIEGDSKGSPYFAVHETLNWLNICSERRLKDTSYYLLSPPRKKMS